MIIEFIIANVESKTLSNIYSVSISTLFFSLIMRDIENLQCLIEIYACFNTFKGRVLGWMQHSHKFPMEASHKAYCFTKMPLVSFWLDLGFFFQLFLKLDI